MSEIKNAKEASEKIIKKALTDAAFKKALLANPNAAIEKELGTKLPAGIKVKVLEDTASVVHLVLPAVPSKSELSDAELGKVAGGLEAYCGNASTAPGKDSVTKKGYCIANTTWGC